MLTKMDVIQFSLGIYCALLLIRGCVNSLVIDVRPRSGIWDIVEKPCSKRCKYGYETDVEGNSMCKCLDPCAHIYCPFEGTKCVVRKSANSCSNGYCKYDATCKKVSRRKKLQKVNYKYKNEVFYGLQQDSGDIINLCSRQPSIDSIYNCAEKTPGYYYDGIKGTCVRFKGCHQHGDFFGTRKDCTRACIRNSLEVQSTKKIEVCNLQPEDNSTCTKLRKLWYFDQISGRCVKSKGCNFSGNGFRRKKLCKNSCKGRNSRKHQRRKRRRFVS